jgi:membrane-associated protease RseP (regulator of RpoE activity)
VTDTDRHSSTTPGDQVVTVEPQKNVDQKNVAQKNVDQKNVAQRNVANEAQRNEVTSVDTTSPSPSTPPASAQSKAQAQPDEGLGKLIPIVAVVAAGIAWSVAAGTFPVVAFVLAIVAMIMIHETGHFITAKWSGMKVTEYFFGFGPRLWSIRKGETTYGIKALPLGGYVKIIGMSNLERGIDPADEPRTYRQQSYPKRVLVAVAGVVTHFVVAFLLLVLLWTVLGVPKNDKPTLTIGEISGLESGATPAIDAGFKVGDRIVSVGGEAATRWEDLPPFIRRNPNRPLNFVVERDGRMLNLVVTPAAIERDGETVGFIGIGSRPAVEKLGFVPGVARAGTNLWDLTTASVKGLGSIFTPSSLKDYASNLTGSAEPGNEGQRPVSVVGVVRIAGQAADSGVFNLVYLLVVLNLFVAVLNLVPLLPFDGGHIAVATYERLRSRRGRRYQADVGKLMPLTAAVVALMLVLGVTSIYLDIINPIGNPFQ